MAKMNIKRVTAKNFRSVNNMGMTIDFTKSQTTVVGSMDNGQGKSTMIVYALYYAFYDKAYGDKGKKSELINTRSGKDCVVEVVLDAGGSEWTIRRGMKPTLFEILKDGVRIEDEASTSDFQQYLVKNVLLGMTESAFCNTVVLGKDRFVPLFSMSAGEIRAYVESMFDLTVFSHMSEMAKDDWREVKRSIEQVGYSIKAEEVKIDSSRRMIDTLEAMAREAEQDLSGERERAQHMVDRCVATRGGLVAKRDEMAARVSAYEVRLAERARTVDVLERIRRADAELERDINRHASHDGNCPTCGKQMDNYDQSAHEAEIATMNAKRSEYDAAMKKLAGVIDDLDAALADSPMDEFQTIRNGIIQVEATMKQAEHTLNEITKKVERGVDREKIEAERKLLEQATSVRDQLIVSRDDFERRAEIIKTTVTMLGDEGIKASIITEYIPALNQLINEYLSKMSLFVQISLDEKFNITMFSPTRKGQSIAALSTGQICRANLANLLAWRRIGQMRASVDCNILVLDEVLENLSESGVEEFMDMWNQDTSLSQTNLFVITQRRQEFEPYFERTILFDMRDEQTVLVED